MNVNFVFRNISSCKILWSVVFNLALKIVNFSLIFSPFYWTIKKIFHWNSQICSIIQTTGRYSTSNRLMQSCNLVITVMVFLSQNFPSFVFLVVNAETLYVGHTEIMEYEYVGENQLKFFFPGIHYLYFFLYKFCFHSTIHKHNIIFYL